MELEEIIVEPQMTLNDKLKTYFKGKVVRKDLSKNIKEGANVPTYVLEFLLGKYCSSNDPDVVAEGVRKVKTILTENYVRPDEAQKVLARIKENGSYSIIDKVTVTLDIKNDQYLAEFASLGIKNVVMDNAYVKQYEKLLCGGIWCQIKLSYSYNAENKKEYPIHIQNISPIQMANLDFDDFQNARGYFDKEEWIDAILRSIGMEPNALSYRVKWLHIMRLMPLVENNINQCELGPRSTGKSHVYKEISPNSILVSGGQTTVANLFYNMSRRQVGLVGLWDCVTFDEVAGIHFKDKDGIQIMKDYMASGSFSRGKEEIQSRASMVFVGNINHKVTDLLQTSSLFTPFPPEIGQDTAFFDRMHCYLPGWEIPKYMPNFFTNEYGMITDYISEVMRESRKYAYTDAIDNYFELGDDLNQRDSIAVRKMVSALIKLVYPDESYTKDDLKEMLELALEMRRRVKEQLHIIGGDEFKATHFSYIDLDDEVEYEVTTPEMDELEGIRNGNVEEEEEVPVTEEYEVIDPEIVDPEVLALPDDLLVEETPLALVDDLLVEEETPEVLALPDDILVEETSNDIVVLDSNTGDNNE